MSTTAVQSTVTDHEAEQVARANESGKTPVVFVHGLRLLPRQEHRRRRGLHPANRHGGYAVRGSGEPIFQAANANVNPWTEAKVDTKNPQRGLLLIVAADQDHTVPPAIAKAWFEKQQRNEGVTEYVEARADAAVRQPHDHFGRLDVVVNNAGYGLFGAVEEVTEQQARAQLETNFFGALRITKAALPLLRGAGRRASCRCRRSAASTRGPTSPSTTRRSGNSKACPRTNRRCACSSATGRWR
jgi:NAD(P)-dependent dehydrogenase (short-subunit alcohol dehydrogenase family)